MAARRDESRLQAEGEPVDVASRCKPSDHGLPGGVTGRLQGWIPPGPKAQEP